MRGRERRKMEQPSRRAPTRAAREVAITMMTVVAGRGAGKEEEQRGKERREKTRRRRLALGQRLRPSAPCSGQWRTPVLSVTHSLPSPKTSPTPMVTAKMTLVPK